MKILILGLNYAPERIGIAVYTSATARALATSGHAVTVVCGQPYYPAWRRMPGFSRLYRRTRERGVMLVRCPHYIPSVPTGGKRILHHLSFALSSLPAMIGAAIRDKPDVVFCVAPSLMSAPVAWLAARLARARSWLHVQDFEVEAAFAVQLLDRDGLLGRLAVFFENLALRRFDRVSAISPQMCDRLLVKGLDPARVVEFRNFGNLQQVAPLAEPSTYRAEWDIRTEHVALYSGNIGHKQGIEIVVEAARLLEQRTDLTFVICGEGPNRANLQRRADGLGNIRFHDLQPAGRLNELMGLATVHLLPQLASAADLVLPSKLTNMLASGRPVVATAASGTGLAEEVTGCGLVTRPESPDGFAAAIMRLLDDPALYAHCAGAARQRAEERWNEEVILARFAGELGRLVDPAGLPGVGADPATPR